MSISNLKNVISADFLKAAGKIGQGTSGQNIAKKLQGGSQTEDLPTSLRLGARNFALGVQALNYGVSFINVSMATHDQLLGLVDKLDALTAQAQKDGLGSQQGNRLIVEFRTVAREFQKVIQDAKVEDKDVLDPNELGAALIKAGLDPEKTDDLKRLFKKLQDLGGTSVNADGEVKSADTLVPVDQFANSVRQAAGDFEAAEDEASGSTVFASVRKALGLLRKEISGNKKILEETRNVVAANMDLVRAAGRAFLDLSDQVTGAEDAERIAQEIRSKVRRDVPGAVDQAANLQSIIVAGVTLAASAQAEKKS